MIRNKFKKNTCNYVNKGTAIFEAAAVVMENDAINIFKLANFVKLSENEWLLKTIDGKFFTKSYQTKIFIGESSLELANLYAQSIAFEDKKINIYPISQSRKLVK